MKNFVIFVTLCVFIVAGDVLYSQQCPSKTPDRYEEHLLFLRHYLEQNLPPEEVNKIMPRPKRPVVSKKKSEKKGGEEVSPSSSGENRIPHRPVAQPISKFSIVEAEKISERNEDSKKNRESCKDSFVCEVPSFQLHPLTQKEKAWARTAWSYFEYYKVPQNGLVQTVAGYRVATLWDIGTMLAALVSAHQIGILEDEAFYNRMKRILEWLTTMPLYHNELPAHAYRVDLGGFANRRGESAKEGYGWSTVDIGRYLIWLKVITFYYPNLAKRTNRIFTRYDFSRAVWKERFYDIVALGRGRERKIRENSFVYLGYTRWGYLLWGLKDIPPDPLEKRLDTKKTEYGEIPVDKHHLERLTTDPIALLAMECGWPSLQWDRLGTLFINAIQRYTEKRKAPFLPGEEPVDRKPWFVYTTLSAHGRPFVCVDIRGIEYSKLANLSLKTAFTLSAVYGDDKIVNLRNRLAEKLKTKRGFWAGRYMNGGINRVHQLNTNGVILESLWFLQRGKKPFLKVKHCFLGKDARPD